MVVRIAWLSLLLSASTLVSAYITRNSAIPQRKQIKWLKKLTVDICESPAGTLSDEMIKEAPAVMKGWTSMKPVNTENALAVERLVKRLVDERNAGNTKAMPTTNDYNMMLESWSRSGEGVFAAERCEQILKLMQERFEAGDSNLKPDLSSFKTALIAWRESGESFGSYRAQRILEWMITLYESRTNELALPDAHCFDIVLQSWSKCSFKTAPRNAEKLLGMMEKLYRETESDQIAPNTISFNSVLAAWNRSKDPQAWRRMCNVLGFMEKLHYVEDNRRVVPDLFSYQTVIGALARSSESHQTAPVADKLLRSIEQKHKLGLLSWKPDTILFNSVQSCWCRAHDNSGGYRKARSILDRQLNMYNKGCNECRPDVYSFTSVLSTCASESGDRVDRLKAFNVAVSTFQQFLHNPEKFGEANHVTYGTMLKACVRLLPAGSDERIRWANKLFEECKSKGLVGEMVLSRFREATTRNDYKRLMEGHTKSTIPAGWTENVHERSEHRRKFGKKKRRGEA